MLCLLFDYLAVCVQLLGDLLQTIFFYRRLKVLYDDFTSLCAILREGSLIMNLVSPTGLSWILTCV